MHWEGVEPVTVGVIHLTDGKRTADAFDTLYDDGIVDTVGVRVEFSTSGLDVQRLSTSRVERGRRGLCALVPRFEGATRYPFSITDRTPGISLSSMGRGCNVETGWFEIHAYRATRGELKLLLASFERRCEGFEPTVGCVHYRGADDDLDAGEPHRD